MAATGWRVAVVGATGAVGRTMLKILEERDFPVSDLRLLARSGSAGKVLPFRGEAVEVQALSETGDLEDAKKVKHYLEIYDDYLE